MTDELGRNQLTSQLKYWQQECQICAEHHNYNCNECICRKRCLQAKAEIKALLQKPGVTEEFVKRWSDFWNDDFHSTLSSHVEPHVRQMLKEAGVEVVKNGRK